MDKQKQETGKKGVKGDKENGMKRSFAPGEKQKSRRLFYASSSIREP